MSLSSLLSGPLQDVPEALFWTILRRHAHMMLPKAQGPCLPPLWGDAWTVMVLLHTFSAPVAEPGFPEELGQDHGAQRVAHSHDGSCEEAAAQGPDGQVDVVSEGCTVRLQQRMHLE